MYMHDWCNCNSERERERERVNRKEEKKREERGEHLPASGVVKLTAGPVVAPALLTATAR